MSGAWSDLCGFPEPGPSAVGSQSVASAHRNKNTAGIKISSVLILNEIVAMTSSWPHLVAVLIVATVIGKGSIPALRQEDLGADVAMGGRLPYC